MSDVSLHSPEFIVRQEADVLPSRAIGRVAAVAGVVAAIAVVIAWWLVFASGGIPKRGSGPAPVAVSRTISGIEQSYLDSRRVGIERRDRQRRELESWGWANRGAGLARIPIDRAIDIVVARESR